MPVAKTWSFFCAALVALLTTAAAPIDASACQNVQVHGDAVFCVSGPVCGGPEPSGWSCPRAGAVAVAACRSGLASSGGLGSCVAPVDAQCVASSTGIWRCEWQHDEAVAAVSRKLEADAGTSGSEDADVSDSGNGATTALVCVAVAAAAAIAVVILVARGKGRGPHAREKAGVELQEVVISPSQPATNTPMSTKKLFVYTAHI
ncbi:hypothetical protein BBJ28_00012480 [Nothophytophthora sp. Chile5]|nr:hypothetical protein BBJ28_00012480 [Nothophytophthora sp. Chile5]